MRLARAAGYAALYNPLAGADDWHQQAVTVFGRSFLLGQVEGGRLYHGSPQHLAPGTVLTPGHDKNFKQSAAGAVSITSDLQTAKHWGSLGGKRRVFIYEVEPLSPVEVWRAGLANFGKSIVLYEGRVASARVLRLVNGRGLSGADAPAPDRDAVFSRREEVPGHRLGGLGRPPARWMRTPGGR